MTSSERKEGCQGATETTGQGAIGDGPDVPIQDRKLLSGSGHNNLTAATEVGQAQR